MNDATITLHADARMSVTQVAVFGICRTGNHALRSVGDLIAAGFSQGNISVLVPDQQGSERLYREKSCKASEVSPGEAAAGGAIGGTLGLLAGIGVLAIPGVGPIIAAGPLMVALTGMSVGGALGGLLVAFLRMGISESKARRYAHQLKAGGVLLSIRCATSDEIGRARDLLRQTGAQDISSSCPGGTGRPAAGKLGSPRQDLLGAGSHAYQRRREEEPDEAEHNASDQR